MPAKLRDPGSKKLKLSVYLEPDLVAAMRVFMARTGMNQADTIRFAVRQIADIL
jgi:hypothetical protein